MILLFILVFELKNIFSFLSKKFRLKYITKELRVKL
jgi:hypothetical protein